MEHLTSISVNGIVSQYDHKLEDKIYYGINGLVFIYMCVCVYTGQCFQI